VKALCDVVYEARFTRQAVLARLLRTIVCGHTQKS
jgi:hypothetical protein